MSESPNAPETQQAPRASTPAPTPTPMSWRRALIGAAVILPIIALLRFGLTHDATEIVSPLPGKIAPDFTLTRMDDGSTVQLASLRGNIVVINFWASWCEPCRDEHSELIRASNAYGPRGVQFYGIVYNDSKPNAQKFFEELGPVPYPTLLENNTHTSIDYGVTGPPETFVIDRNGVVVYKKFGPFCGVEDVRCAKPNELNAVLDSLLKAS